MSKKNVKLFEAILISSELRLNQGFVGKVNKIIKSKAKSQIRNVNEEWETQFFIPFPDIKF